MKVKSESEVAQSCPTPSDPMDCGPPGSSVHGIFQEWGAIAFSIVQCRDDQLYTVGNDQNLACLSLGPDGVRFFLTSRNAPKVTRQIQRNQRVALSSLRERFLWRGTDEPALARLRFTNQRSGQALGHPEPRCLHLENRPRYQCGNGTSTHAMLQAWLCHQGNAGLREGA